MDNTNSMLPAREPTSMEANNWRTQLPQEARQKTVNKIMDMLIKHLPSFVPQEVPNVKSVVLRFEKKIFTIATSQEDYVSMICSKLLSLKTKTWQTVASSSPSGPAYNIENFAHQASDRTLPQLYDQGQSLSNPLASHPQGPKQLLFQEFQNCIASSMVESSANSTLTVTAATNSSRIPMTNVVNKNPNLETSTISQRQVQGRQYVLPVAPQPDQQHVQNAEKYPYKQQLQDQLRKQNFNQGNIIQSDMQTEIQQGEQQQIILSPSQQSVMHTSVMRSAPSGRLQQNSQSSVQLPMQSGLQQHLQSISEKQQLQQTPVIHQGTSKLQQPILPLQQQQQLPNATNMHDQLHGHQNTVPDMQYQQQLLGQNNHSSRNLQHLSKQSNASSLNGQSSNSSMHNDQQSKHVWPQAEVEVQQQTQQTDSALLSTQGQSQPPKQQLMSQIQAQLAKSLQQDMQQSLRTSGSLLQPQHLFEQQKQSSEIQSPFPVVSSMALDYTSQTRHVSGDDWKEELYQKIQTLKDLFLPELKELYKKISIKLHQFDSIPQHPKIAEYEKLKGAESLWKKAFVFLQLPKCEMSTDVKRMLGGYEKLIHNLLQLNRSTRSIPFLRQEQLPTHDMLSLQQPLQPQFQNPKLQSNGNLNNPLLQSMNSHHYETSMEKNFATSLMNASTISSEVSTSQQNMMNLQQLGTNSDSEQGNSVSLLLENPANSSQSCTSSSQSGGNMPGKKINHLELNSNMLQNMCLKQPNEPHIIKVQQAKRQFQQQMTKQLMQQKEQIELQHRQQPVKLLAHQSPQIHQTSEVNSMKVRQGMGVKAGNCLQHHSVGKLSVNNPCIVKSEPQSPMSSPQLLRIASPQIPQHSSPQIDQKILQTSFNNSGSRLHSPNSISIAPPSTLLGPFPIKGDPNKLTSDLSSLTSSGNNELKETSDALALDTAFVISTPGLSPSLLLAESDLDRNHNDVSTTEFCEPSVTEEPIQQLIKVVRSMPYKALSASVSDMESVVRMVERTAGSIPGNGSRSAVGEDLVAVTNFHLQGEKLDGNSITTKMRCNARAMPSKTLASDCITDSFKQFTDPETHDELSTATSHNKRPRVEVNWTLLKEIREINQRLIDTVVDISEEGVNSTTASVTEGGEGTIVKCSFNAVAINPNMKTEPASAPVSPILPLRLLVPRNYPDCSPVLLDKLPAEVSTEYEDLSVKAKSKLSVILRNLLQPMSLGEIARSWDVCARAVISEYAQQNGGGTFSSRYGTWENHLSAA